jgi:hypothetical protein
MSKTTTHPLLDKWNLYYHLPDNNSWDLKSYKLILGGVSNLEQLININEVLPNCVIKFCMLFLMRSHIAPMWEDHSNCQGGAFSYNISNEHISLVWRELMYLMCGESLCVNQEHHSSVNGITVSPKSNFCTLKIWMKDLTHQDPAMFVPIKHMLKEGCLFFKHGTSKREIKKK